MKPPMTKARYGPGPWHEEPDELAWTHREVPCLIRRVQFSGALCGYARLPFGHPWWGMDWAEVPAEVHGGITFAGSLREFQRDAADRIAWWIGFDCAHAWDFSPGLAATSREIGITHARFPGEVYRSLAYVKEQAEELADQVLSAARVPRPWCPRGGGRRLPWKLKKRAINHWAMERRRFDRERRNFVPNVRKLLAEAGVVLP